MKISLRKADALQKLINEKINETELATTVLIGRFDEPQEKFEKAVVKFQEVLNRKIDLLRALYSLRAAVSLVGTREGVSEILAEIAMLEKTAAILKPLAKIEEYAPSEGTLKLQHDDLVADKAVDRYSGRRDAFSVSVVDRNDVVAFASQIDGARKEKQMLSDRLLDLNVRHEIELTDELETILQKHGII